MKKVFVDTNIFLHFKFFTEINWLELCQDNKCEIIVALIVIDELDKHKIGNDERSKRARKVLKQIESYSENQPAEVSPDVGIELLNTRPKISIYRKYHLNKDEHDDQLIASIIEYRSSHELDEIFLCSNDIGPRLRSKPFAIDILKMPDSYLLPEKDTPIEKQLKELAEENTLLKSRIPKPLLQFENGKDFIKIKVNESIIEKYSFIDDRLIKIKEEYPHLVYDEKQNKFNPLATLASFSLISKEQIDRYNTELNDFYTEYGLYLHSLYDYELKNNLSVRINIFITNLGNVPCEDVDIYCNFPDGFELIEERDFEDPPKKPTPPSTPKTMYENLTSGFNFYRPHLYPDININTLPKINRPNIKKTNSYEVHFEKEYVKHCTIYPLDTLIAIYDSFSEMKNFSINYSLITGNVPEPIEGVLNVIFEKYNAS